MFAVRGEIVVEFARKWMEEYLNVERRTSKAEHRIGGELETANERRADEEALEAVLGSCEWKIREFERGEVVRAFEEGTGMADVINAAEVHLRGGSAEEKRKLAFALHMMWVYGDKDGVFLDILVG